MVSAISSGWSAYSENPLPLCNGHTNRIFLTNGKHPGSQRHNRNRNHKKKTKRSNPYDYDYDALTTTFTSTIFCSRRVLTLLTTTITNATLV